MTSRIVDRLLHLGLSANQLSLRSGISQDRVEQILSGNDPTMSELRRLSSAFRLPMEAFVEKAESEEEALLLFRSSFGKHETGSKIQASEEFSRRIAHSLELVRANVSYPDWLSDLSRPSDNAADAESSAQEFRARFCGGDQVSPLLDLPKVLADQLGVMLFVVSGQAVDGASAIIDGVAYVFVSERFSSRMLFTVAHELGHLIAHHRESDRFAWIDDAEHTGSWVVSKSQLERFSDEFASNLLIPRGGLAIAISRIKALLQAGKDAIGDVEILYLSRIFGVSFQVAARRCESLGLLPSGGARALYNQLKKQHGGPERRARSLDLPDRPTVEFPVVSKRLIDAAVSAIREGRVSIGRASADLNISIGEIMDANK